MSVSSDFIDLLRLVYSPDRLFLGDGPLSSYQSDGLTAFAVKPIAVVVPESSEEVIETVRLCHRKQVPFVARGSGTSLSGGSLPVAGGIVIALNRLNRILALDAEQRIARVEPGVINLDVTLAAQPYGLRYAPDPSSQQICTIGGNLAFNAGGAHCLKYGMTSNHVIGVRAILATGEVVEFGGDGLERVGPDWTALFVGSEGLFGVALEITLRLVPAVEVYHTALVAYESLEAAGRAVSSIVASSILPGAMEIMDSLAIEAAEAAVNAGYPVGAAAILIVELEGPQEQLASEIPKLASIIDKSSAKEVRIAANEDERALIWKGRKSAFSAVGRISPDFIVQDGWCQGLGWARPWRKWSAWGALMAYVSPMCFTPATAICTHLYYMREVRRVPLKGPRSWLGKYCECAPAWVDPLRANMGLEWKNETIWVKCSMKTTFL
ncbi:MAG: FAD-binding protein [Opitutales bacterium]